MSRHDIAEILLKVALNTITHISRSAILLHKSMVVVFNADFNNISAISWRSVLLMEETRVTGENHRPVASH